MAATRTLVIAGNTHSHRAHINSASQWGLARPAEAGIREICINYGGGSYYDMQPYQLGRGRAQIPLTGVASMASRLAESGERNTSRACHKSADHALRSVAT